MLHFRKKTTPSLDEAVDREGSTEATNNAKSKTYQKIPGPSQIRWAHQKGEDHSDATNCCQKGTYPYFLLRFHNENETCNLKNVSFFSGGNSSKMHVLQHFKPVKRKKRFHAVIFFLQESDIKMKTIKSFANHTTGFLDSFQRIHN
jgi:hypothetical protein